MIRDEGDSILKPFFRNPVMWIGFAVPFLLGSYHSLHGYFPALPPMTISQRPGPSDHFLPRVPRDHHPRGHAELRAHRFRLPAEPRHRPRPVVVLPAGSRAARGFQRFRDRQHGNPESVRQPQRPVPGAPGDGGHDRPCASGSLDGSGPPAGRVPKGPWEGTAASTTATRCCPTAPRFSDWQGDSSSSAPGCGRPACPCGSCRCSCSRYSSSS